MTLNPWELLLSLIGGALAFFYQIIPNYGIAIVLLTLAVSLVMFPLTLKQTRSMKAMQEIQPEVKRLQKEFKHDKEELNKRLMALYQEKGVNPAAGCLPLLIQMPIWFALFSVLRNGSGIPAGSTLAHAVEPARQALQQAIDAGVSLSDPAFLGDAVFAPVRFLGMNLLVSPSQVVGPGNLLGSLPYVVLLVAIIAAGFYQQLQTTRTRSNDASQQMQGMQTAMKIMPIFFGFISWSLPTGLDVYFVTSNLFRIGQQAVILRMDGQEGEGNASTTQAPEPAGGEDGRKGPSKHSSKKRKRRRRK